MNKIYYLNNSGMIAADVCCVIALHTQMMVDVKHKVDVYLKWV